MRELEKQLRITEDERDKVFEEFQTAEEKLLTAEEVATKVSAQDLHDPSNLSFPLLSLSLCSSVLFLSHLYCLSASMRPCARSRRTSPFPPLLAGHLFSPTQHRRHSSRTIW